MGIAPIRSFGALFAALLLTAGLAGSAAAQTATMIDLFDDWEALTVAENGKKYCFMGSVPKKEEGGYTRRGRVAALVTHRPADRSVGIVSIEAGYAYKPGSTVDVAIGEAQFKFFTEDEFAWVYEKDEKAVLDAMRRGAVMVVKGTSSRGTVTTDTYSLKGFTAAYNAISRACGVTS